MKKCLTALLLTVCLLLTMAGCYAAGAERIPDGVGVSSAGNQITPEKAQQIALDYVGLTADQVQDLRSRLEIDDGRPQYDVEFFADNQEHEFEIDAATGDILSYDRDDRRD